MQKLNVKIDCRFEPNLGLITAIIDPKKFSIRELCLGGLEPNFPLPQSIENLKNLEILTLGYELKEVPDFIVNLKKLKELSLAALNQVPTWIGSLKNLENINIQNGLFDSLPESFGNLKKLNAIRICDTNLNTLPESFSTLLTLEELILERNQFINIPKVVLDIQNLKRLDLMDNPLISPFKELFNKYITPSRVSVLAKNMENFKHELLAINSNLDESSFTE
jgi:Leucine-rich repeat (LRR) protein